VAVDSTKGTGTEVTIAFPKNDHLLAAAQKELANIINAGAPAEIMKVVKPVNKDFNEDLQAEKQEGKKINHDLGEVPSYIRTGAKNLLQQLSAYSNNAFDALFGGIPGSLPRMINAPEEKKPKPETTNEKGSAPEELKKKEHDIKDLSAISQTYTHKLNNSSNQAQPHKTNHKGENTFAEKDSPTQSVSKQPSQRPGFRMKMR
jgi:hypothetical protein